MKYLNREKSATIDIDNNSNFCRLPKYGTYCISEETEIINVDNQKEPEYKLIQGDFPTKEEAMYFMEWLTRTLWPASFANFVQSFSAFYTYDDFTEWRDGLKNDEHGKTIIKNITDYLKEKEG